MCRALSQWMVAAILLSSPLPLLAGGPPVIFLPVDGVTAENATTCASLLNAKLKEKGLQIDDADVVRRSNAWCIAVPFAKDVRLSDLTSAFKESAFSIPMDQVHLFGHVVLEIDANSSSAEKLVPALKSIPNVAVESSESKGNSLLVTLDMPYPVGQWRPSVESATWDTFQRNDLSSDPSRDEISPRELPSFRKIREVLSKNDAKLVDVRWRGVFSCRPVGGIKSAETQKVSSRSN